MTELIIKNEKRYSENEQLILSRRDNEIFFEAIFQQSPPNDLLVEAVNEYKQILSE